MSFMWYKGIQQFNNKMAFLAEFMAEPLSVLHVPYTRFWNAVHRCMSLWNMFHCLPFLIGSIFLWVITKPVVRRIIPQEDNFERFAILKDLEDFCWLSDRNDVFFFFPGNCIICTFGFYFCVYCCWKLCQGEEEGGKGILSSNSKEQNVHSVNFVDYNLLDDFCMLDL